MLYNYHQNLMHTALLSKEVLTKSSLLPTIKQLLMTVKIDNNYDFMNNLSLLVSLIDNNQIKLSLVNQKNVQVIPVIMLNNLNLKNYMTTLVSLLTQRLSDKTIIYHRGITSNKLTFLFKNSDAISADLRKIWKLFGYEVGVFSAEITFNLTSHNSVLNEAFLRSFHLPVVIKN